MRKAHLTAAKWVGTPLRVPKKATLTHLSAGSAGQAAGVVTATAVPAWGYRWDVSWVKR